MQRTFQKQTMEHSQNFLKQEPNDRNSNHVHESQSSEYPKPHLYSRPTSFSEGDIKDAFHDVRSSLQSEVDSLHGGGLDHLGLSTHRPGSDIDSSRSIKKEFYQPVNNETIGEIFSEKTTEEMRAALGEEAFENLMRTMNRNLRGEDKVNSHAESSQEVRQYPAPLKRSLSPPRSSRSVRDCSPRFSSSFKKAETLTRDLSEIKEGEKEVLTLVRNYDQVTVPKNTRNSFSADEIYRQAFGTTAVSERGSHKQNTSNPMWQNSRAYDHNDNAFQSDYFNHHHSMLPPSKYPLNGAAGFASSYPVYHPHSPHAYHQSPSFPPPSPHSTVPQSPKFYSNQETNGPLSSDPGYSMYRNPTMSQPPTQFHDNHYPPSPTNPYSMYHSQPGTGFFTYPPPYLNPHVLKFPENGVPLHLPPPPIPPPPYPQQGSHWQPPVHQPPLVSPGRRNSLTHIHSYHPQSQEHPKSGFMKVPHPPPHPPALKPREDKLKGKPNESGTREAVSDRDHHDSSKMNNYSLQRYFSSIELSSTSHEQEQPAHHLAASAPNSSRSVRDNFSQFAEDDCASSVSEGTRVTTYSKASGITDRLRDLGVDLNHLKLLKVVEKNMDQAADDAAFETLSRGIRRCPECGSGNKAYMDWCTDCGEILIGIEPTLPNSRKKNEEKERRKRLPPSKAGGFREGRKQNEKVSKGIDIYEMKSMRDSLPKESPESGKGLSLSSSPVRHWRDAEDIPETKDSGRDSCTDQRDHTHLYGEVNEDISEEEIVEEFSPEDVESENSEKDFFAQISDPVLREFIISYRKRQTAADVNKGNASDSLDNQDRENLDLKPKVEDELKSSVKTTTFNVTAASHSKNEIVRPTASKDTEPKKSTKVSNKDSGNKSSWCAGMSDNGPQISETKPSSKSSRKKKKKKEMMDIEIFGYEEIRQSRQSYQEINTNVVPALNLANSSDEEDSSSDSDSSNDAETSEDKINDHDILGDDSTDSDVAEKSEVLEAKSQNQSSDKISKAVLEKTGAKDAKAKGNRASDEPTVSKSYHSMYHARTQGRAERANGYPRKWEKSSIAWSSYNPRELNTRSSLTDSRSINPPRPASAGQRRNVESKGRADNHHQSKRVGTPQSPASGIPVRQRPSSAENVNRRALHANEAKARPSSASSKQASSASQFPESQSSPNLSQKAGSSNRQKNPCPKPVKGPAQTNNGRFSGRSVQGQPGGNVGRNAVATTSTSELRPGSADSDSKISQQGSESTEASPRFLCNDIHRLAIVETEENHAEKLHAVAQSSYDRLQEMTPRIAEGVLSMWECLPDEIWLYIFDFLSQPDLRNVMITCRLFYRLANDETLWRYITVKPRYQMTDGALAAISRHRPVSIALLKCQGQYVTEQGLHSFFQETQEKLRELNICGCSQGALVGSVVLDVASKYCHQLTHLDASFCNISNESFLALSQCAQRLESVCVNGFQRMLDASLIEFLKKHGKSLQTLELYACFSLSAAALRSIGEHCTSLKRLCLGSCNKLTDSTMITLSTHLARIEELDLRGCKNLRNDCVRKIVRNCPRIHTLVLANCQQISDIALTEIATYLKTTLRSLDVCGCNQVSDTGVVGLAKNCDLLACVDISSTKCTSTSVNQLAVNNCNRWLHTVKLSFLTSMPESCIQNLIKHCPRLKLVHVFGCSSLKNLSKLRALKSSLCLEGDSDGCRHSMS